MNEVLCADISRDMNDLAERLLRGGNMGNDHGFEALFFRQFLAQSSKVIHTNKWIVNNYSHCCGKVLKGDFLQISYDLVVSAYSLVELSSLKERLKTLDILWNKTNNYLVIVEQGSAAGFNVRFIIFNFKCDFNNC